MSTPHRFVSFLRASPERLFWSFALLHLLVWTALPSLACPNLPLDVIEGYAWGYEWPLGTYKHPPMQAWILESLYTLSGRVRWTSYLASQIAIVTSFWAVWQTGRRIAGDKAALVGVMLLEGIVYYNFTSPEFNPNVLQLPFWALAGWSFHKAMSDNKIKDWLLLGLWAAGGMYTKYSSGLFILMLLLTMLSHRDGRKRLGGIGPYLSLFIGFTLFLPHLLWLIDHDFLPLDYAAGRLDTHGDHYPALLTTAMMVLGQFVALGFLFLLLTALYDRRHAPAQPPLASFDRLFLTVAAFGPFTLMFCLSLFMGFHVRDMWETPFWNFLGLWAVVLLRPAFMPQDLRRFSLSWSIVFLIGVIAFAGSETLGPYLDKHPKRTIFPGSSLAQQVNDAWQARYHAPLRYAIGDPWPAGNLAWYSPQRLHVFIDANPTISPWIDLADLKKSGGVVVWCLRCNDHHPPQPQPAFIASLFPRAEVQPPLTLKRLTGAPVLPAQIGWALVPPEGAP